jgi:hypothetical protein
LYSFNVGGAELPVLQQSIPQEVRILVAEWRHMFGVPAVLWLTMQKVPCINAELKQAEEWTNLFRQGGTGLAWCASGTYMVQVSRLPNSPFFTRDAKIFHCEHTQEVKHRVPSQSVS